MKALDKGTITKEAIRILQYNGFDAWRNNNIAVRGRKFTGRYGVPDIAGYYLEDGRAMYCEVKTINDKYSDEQEIFLAALKKAGGFAFKAFQVGSEVIVDYF